MDNFCARDTDISGTTHSRYEIPVFRLVGRREHIISFQVVRAVVGHTPWGVTSFQHLFPPGFNMPVETWYYHRGIDFGFLVMSARCLDFSSAPAALHIPVQIQIYVNRW